MKRISLQVSGLILLCVAFSGVGLAQAPTVTSFAPSSGPIGTPVTIQGQYFGASQGSSTISLNGTNASVLAWSDSQIIAMVPSGAASGTFTVTVNGQNGTSSNSFTITSLPSGWTDQDIGAVGLAGSASYANGTFTVKGSGSDIPTSGSSDQFHFVYQPLSGDGTIVARVASLRGGKAGVMVRETLTTGSTEAFTTQDGSTHFDFIYRTTTGANSSYGYGSDSLPYWMKLVRSGNSFSFYVALDGLNWVQQGSAQTITMATNVYVGLAVTSVNNSTLTTATFDNVSVNSTASPAPVITSLSATTGTIGSQVIISGQNFGNSQGSSLVLLNGTPVTINSWSATSITITIPSGATSGYLVVSMAPSFNVSNPVEFAVTSNPLPPGWLDEDVGAVGLEGNATYANQVFTVKGSGSDICCTSDQFHFVYQPLSGDGTIVARVVSIQGGGSNQKAGVMIRETLTSGSTDASTLQQGGSAVLFLYRPTTGGNSSSSQTGDSLPYWVKVVRSGSSFSGYMARDGVNWVQVGSTQTITMATNVYIGLGVTSNNNSVLATATFDNVSVTSSANPAPVITSLSATTGSVGSQVVISGQNFGSFQSGNVVLLNGAAVTINSWNATSITITIPTGATSGPLIVSVAPSFDDSNPVQFTISSNPLPTGWLDQDVGPVGLSGSASYLNGTFTVQASGTDIYGNSDGFHFVYQTLSGNGTIVARMTGIQGGGSNPKFGVMIRETLTATSTFAFMGNQGTGSALFTYRSTTGGSTPQTTNNDSLPYWVKLIRSGNNFSGYMSLDGVNWSQVGSTQTITMAQNVYLGLAFTSNNNSSLATTSFDGVSVISSTNVTPAIASLSETSGSAGSQVTITGLNFGNSQAGSAVFLTGVTAPIISWSSTSIIILVPSAATSGPLVVAVSPNMNSSNPIAFTVTGNPLPPDWLDMDIGSIGKRGSGSYSGGTFTVQASGTDIYGNSDGFHFVYQPLSGDGTIVARMTGIQGGGSNPKFGVMIRETLTATSTFAFMGNQGTGSALFTYRSTTGGSTPQTTSNDSLPYWVKLIRRGNNFSGYISVDGVSWFQVGSTQTITMAQNVYLGLAFTSNNNSVLATTTLDSVSVSSFNASVGGLWGVITNASNGSAISGAQVLVSQQNTTRATRTSDVNGRFAIGNLPEGAYDVTASASGFGTSVSNGVVVLPFLDTTLNVSLTAPGSISGKVTQADGVTAIPGATVQALAGVTVAGSMVTDANGNFTVSALNAGNYQTQASAVGYSPGVQSASVTAGSATTVNFALQGPGSSSGSVNYIYDALGRLVGVISPSGDAATYSYDAVGNLLSISRYNSAQLSIITFTPGRGPVGTTVTIYGTGFSSTVGQNSVQFNGVAAVVQTTSPTQLLVTVPSGATSGLISVTTAAGTVTSSSSYTVTNP